ncbi:unnamed protein product [Blepharisma stoltei]|uniref:Gamma-tubulin complex component n=1 Tax=Blepharisma stoltei TaxID=1481888 RepID=A0AAU9KE73_9CILI|nr:unnamed protein product [Blepharisma stoltei]
MDPDSAKRVPVLIERLLKQELPAEVIPRYQPYFLRLLASRINPTVVEDESQILNSILRRISPQNTAKLQDLYIRLTRSRGLSRRWAILYVLSKLFDDNSVAIPGSSLELLAPRPPEAPKIKEKIPIISKKGPDAQMPVLEKEILRDILFAIQGIEGKYITFSMLEDSYVIQPNIGVPDPIRKMVGELAELGWLYKKVVKYIDTNIEQPSLTSQSLCYALQSDLAEYYRLIALLEQQRDELKDLNLRKIMLWCTEPLERMKWLAIISDAAEGLKGGALVSSLYSYTLIGNPSVKAIIIRILDEVSMPIVQMIQQWMLEGEINDPYHEFFVSTNLATPDDRLWTQKYSLNTEMVPSFFTPQLANKILLTGKSINFLRRCCKEENWIAASPLELPKIHDLVGLSKWVDSAARVANAELVKVLFEKYRFKEHCNSIRKYLLLGQGDFHHILMELVNDTLKEKAEKIYKHNLFSILESAIKSSNAQFHDLEFLNRLDVKFLEVSPGDIGWDVFTLDYKVDPPLNTIFTPQAMEKYLRIFKFLWRLKRVQFSLNSYQAGREIIMLQKMKEIAPIIHSCLLRKTEILHFVNNLMNYLMVEVVEGSWAEFMKSLDSVQDLDQIIEVHNAFLDKLIMKSFLGSETDAILKQLLRLLEPALRFRQSQNTLFLSAKEEYDRLSKMLSEDEGEDAISRISLESIEDIKQISEIFSDGVNKFREQLAETDRNHLKFLAFRLDFNEFYSYSQMKRADENAKMMNIPFFRVEDDIEDADQEEFKF